MTKKVFVAMPFMVSVWMVIDAYHQRLDEHPWLNMMFLSFVVAFTALDIWEEWSKK